MAGFPFAFHFNHQKGGKMAVAQKPVPKWVALVSGNMDQHLRFAPTV